MGSHSLNVPHLGLENRVLVLVGRDLEIRGAVEGAILCCEFVVDGALGLVVEHGIVGDKREDDGLSVALLHDLFLIGEQVDDVAHLESWHSELVAHLVAFLPFASCHVLVGAHFHNLSARLDDPHSQHLLLGFLEVVVIAFLEGEIVKLRELLDGSSIVELDEHSRELMASQFLDVSKLQPTTHLDVGLAGELNIGA